MSTAPRPNILFILTDQWPHNYFGRMGYCVDTPSVDDLAKRSTVFRNAFTTCPLCSPARGTLLTGRWLHQTGLRDNVGIGYSLQTPLDPAERTWIDVAAKQGYHVGYFGKWHLGTDGPIHRGAHDHSEGFDPHHRPYGPERPFNYEQTAADAKAAAAKQITEGRPMTWGPCREGKPAGANDADTADRAEAFLAEAPDDQPFFCTASFYGPHFPHYLSEPYTSLARSLDPDLPGNLHDDFAGKPAFQRRPWWPCMDTADIDDAEWRTIRAFSAAHVRQMDDYIGRLLGALAKRQDADRTIVVFAADHGDMDGAHNRFDKGPYFYDEVWRIPLMVSAPNTPAVENDAYVQLIDLGRTLLEWIGADPSPDRPWAGRDLRPLLGSEAVDRRAFPDVAFGQYDLYNGISFTVRAVRTPQWKYVWNPQDVDELYDLTADPDELHNLADDPQHAEVKGQLQRALQVWMQQTGDDAPRRTADVPPAGTVLATGKPGP